MSSNKDNGRWSANRRKPLSEFYAGYATELNVEHEAAELGMLPVREKRLRRIVSNRLYPGRTQQASKRSTYALVVVNHCDVGGACTVHKESD